jgi:hypothetical protein
MNETILEADIEFTFNSFQKVLSNERSVAVVSLVVSLHLLFRPC